jgi:hypothetical protein
VCAGVDDIAVDTSLYDPVLDMVAALGVTPPRFASSSASPLAAYFAMARGAPGVPALDMSKWCARALCSQLPREQCSFLPMLSIARALTLFLMP